MLPVAYLELSDIFHIQYVAQFYLLENFRNSEPKAFTSNEK